jgi:hypothetical protein
VTNFIARWVLKIAKLSVRNAAGCTIWPFIFIWPPALKDNEPLIRHEKVHLKQWTRYLLVGFPFVYFYQMIVWGYQNMPLEKEARAAEYDRREE